MSDAAEVPAPLPRIPRLRQLRALAGKELAVASARGGVWTAQFVFLAYLAIVLGFWLFSGEGQAGSLELRTDGERLILILLHSLYIGALVLGPIIGAGAFQEERERGMLEVLHASPVARRDIFIAGVGARVGLLALSCFAAAPLLAVPIAAGAPLPWEAMLRGFGVTLLAATTAILFAVGRTARGHSPVAVAGGLFLLILITPLGIGLRWRWIILGFGGGSVITGIAMHEFGLGWAFWMIFAAVMQPFSVLSGIIEGGYDEFPVASIAAISVVGLLAVRFGIIANREIALWWGRDPSSGRLDLTRRRRGVAASERLAEAIAAAARHLRAPAPGSATGEEAATGAAGGGGGVLHVPLVATQRIAAANRVARLVHRASGRSGFVARRLAESGTGTASLIAGLGLACVHLLALGFSDRPRAVIEWWTTLSVFGIGLFAAVGIARSVPVRRRRGSWDALLSAPLGGRGYAVGAAGVALLETLPIVAAGILGQIALARLGTSAAQCAASAFLIASTAILAAGVGAGGALSADRFAPRLTRSFLVLGGLLLPGALLGPDSLAGELSAIRPWIAKTEDRAAIEVLGAASAHAALGLALLALAALRFERLRRRP